MKAFSGSREELEVNVHNDRIIGENNSRRWHTIRSVCCRVIVLFFQADVFTGRRISKHRYRHQAATDGDVEVENLGWRLLPLEAQVHFTQRALVHVYVEAHLGFGVSAHHVDLQTGFDRLHVEHRSYVALVLDSFAAHQAVIVSDLPVRRLAEHFDADFQPLLERVSA